MVPLISDSFPQKILRLSVALFEMFFFLIVDRFWNATAVQTTLVQLPSKVTDTGSKEALCLTYDTSSLLQLIAALIIVKLVVSVLLHLRDY